MFGIVATVMGGEMKGRKIDLDLFRNPLVSHILLQDPDEVGHPDASFVLLPDPARKILIDPFSKLFVLLDFVIGLGQGATAGAAEGAEGMILSPRQGRGCGQPSGDRHSD